MVLEIFLSKIGTVVRGEDNINISNDDASIIRKLSVRARFHFRAGRSEKVLCSASRL